MAASVEEVCLCVEKFSAVSGGAFAFLSCGSVRSYLPDTRFAAKQFGPAGSIWYCRLGENLQGCVEGNTLGYPGTYPGNTLGVPGYLPEYGPNNHVWYPDNTRYGQNSHVWTRVISGYPRVCTLLAIPLNTCPQFARLDEVSLRGLA
ncbi:unnamed protein product [Laminaria digitata]